MMNGSVVLALILTSLVIHSNATLDQTEWQFWDDENVEVILKKITTSIEYQRLEFFTL